MMIKEKTENTTSPCTYKSKKMFLPGDETIHLKTYKVSLLFYNKHTQLY